MIKVIELAQQKLDKNEKLKKNQNLKNKFKKLMQD